MKETSPPPHTGSEPFTPTVGVKNRYSVLARGRFSPARLAKAPTLGSGARVDSQTALCRAGTAAIPVVFVGFPPGVRRSGTPLSWRRKPLGLRPIIPISCVDCAQIVPWTHPRLYKRLY